MEHRAGDRRISQRFEVVGTLGGSLEVLCRLEVRNLGPHGVLVKARESYPVGSILRGKLTVRGCSRDVRAVVRYVTTASLKSDKNPYLVGLEFQDGLPDMDDVLEPQPEAPVAPERTTERRRGIRVEQSGDAELDVPVWLTVAFRDLSLGGVMFTSATTVEPGSRAHLHTRLDDHGFSAEIEVRRVESQTARQRGYGIAAAFVAMDDESRRHLAAFLTTSEN